jgi:hypothetical protein
MQRIITYSCGLCGLELAEAFGTSAFCGTTHIECQHCFNLNKTDSKPYSRMSTADIIWGILKNFVSDIIFIVSGGIFFLFAIYLGRYNDRVSLVSLLVFIIYNGVKVILLSKEISKIEKEQKRIDKLLKER